MFVAKIIREERTDCCAVCMSKSFPHDVDDDDDFDNNNDSDRGSVPAANSIIIIIMNL